MKFLYCPNCGKMTGHKRVIGMGTLIGGVFTLGASLNAIPFYPIRCIVCGRKSESSNAEFNPKSQESHQTPDVTIQSNSESQEMDTKKCPFCAEIIKFEAIKCRYCGERFDPADVAKQVDDARSIEDMIPCSDDNCKGGIMNQNQIDEFVRRKHMENASKEKKRKHMEKPWYNIKGD